MSAARLASISSAASASTGQTANERGFYTGENSKHLLEKVRSRAATAATQEDRMFYAGLLASLQNKGVPLPAIPEVVLQIQRVIDAPDCQVDPLVRAIATEPTVATKLVGVANSSIYGGMDPVSNLKRAVMRIGFREARNVVLSILSRSKFFRVPGFEAETAELYEKTLASALAAQMLATRMNIDPDKAFLAGLTHDLGSVVILAIAADVFRSSKGKLVVSRATIDEALEAWHAEMSTLVANAWDVSREIAGAVMYHHRPEEAPDEVKSLAQLLHMADTIACSVTEGIEVGEDAAGGLEALDVRTEDIVASTRDLLDTYGAVSSSKTQAAQRPAER
jgi:HD-like signal output (HDOD) protein